jgi:hypothetical protein
MKYILWVCDRCGEEKKQTLDQLPREWVVVNISSPQIRPQALNWCGTCLAVITTPMNPSPTPRRIKAPKTLIEVDEEEEEEEDEEEDLTFTLDK